MRILKLMSCFFLLLVLAAGCGESGDRLDLEAYKRATLVAGKLDSNSVKFFRKWNFMMRGNDVCWSKIENGNAVFNSWITKQHDSTILHVPFGIKPFIGEFPLDSVPDTTGARSFAWIKTKNETVSLAAESSPGKFENRSAPRPLKQVFLKDDPFYHFANLNEFIDKYLIIGIVYNPSVRDFIQFQITPEHTLTWLPPGTRISPDVQAFWNTEFAKGRTIDGNWNFRRLDTK